MSLTSILLVTCSLTHTHTHIARCLRVLMLIFLNTTAWDADKFYSSYMHDQGHSRNSSKWTAWRKAMNRIWKRRSSVDIVHRSSDFVQLWLHVRVHCICKSVPVCSCLISRRRLQLIAAFRGCSFCCCWNSIQRFCKATAVCTLQCATESGGS
jgi:hypothetical protein